MSLRGMHGIGAMQKPGRVVFGLMIANLVAYVLELVFMRLGFDVLHWFAVSPLSVFERAYLWQPFTYMWLHAPDSPTHLLFNLLWLFMFGPKLESWWGGRRFFRAYVVFGLAGALLTLLFGLLSATSLFHSILSGFWIRPHFGASGATMGITIAWGLTFANQELNLFLLGQMKGKTFVALIVAFELLVALSFDSISSTSHFGGMIAAWVLCRGLWRPSRVAALGKQLWLKRRKKQIERDLRIIQGGGEDKPPPNGGGHSHWN